MLVQNFVQVIQFVLLIYFGSPLVLVNNLGDFPGYHFSNIFALEDWWLEAFLCAWDLCPAQHHQVGLACTRPGQGRAAFLRHRCQAPVPEALRFSKNDITIQMNHQQHIPHHRRRGTWLALSREGEATSSRKPGCLTSFQSGQKTRSSPRNGHVHEP